MNLVKKAFASLTITAMAVMTLAPAGFVSAQTVTLEAGDLIKASGAAVYYYASNGKRYVFPNQPTYKTWYADFSGVKTISDSQLASIMIGGNIVYRPGTRLVKITTDPKVYAVGPGGKLYWVQDEATAVKLYGSNWSQRIDDVSDAFFTNYMQTGMNVGDRHPDGQFIHYLSAPEKKYLVWEGKKRMVTSTDAQNANRLRDEFLVALTDDVTYPNGADLSSGEMMLVDAAQLGSTTTTPGTGGTLTVSLAADTPAAKDIPAGALRPATDVIFTTLNLTAGSTPVNLKGLSIKRGGLSVNSDLENVQLFDAQMNELGNAGSFNANDKVKFTFNKMIPANSTFKVYVAGDNKVGATGRIQLGVEAASDIVSDSSSVQGTFPVFGNTMVQVNVDVGQLVVSTGPNNPNTDKEIDVDSVNERFMEVKLTAGSTEAIRVEGISFEKGDNATFSVSDLINYTLFNETTGTKLAEGTVDGDFVRFNFTSAIILEKGQSVTLSLRADVAGGAGDIVTFSLYDNDSWLIRAKGQTYGFGSFIDTTTIPNFGAGGSNAETAKITISKGKVVVSRGANAPAVGDIAQGGDQVDIASFNFNVKGEPVRMDKMTFTLTCGGGLVCNDNSNLSLFRLEKTNGDLVAGPFDPKAGNIVEFSNQIELPIGDTELFIVADINDAAPNGGTVQVQLTPSTGIDNLKGMESNKSITAAPGGAVVANTQTVDAARIQVTAGGLPAPGTVVIKGSQQEVVGSVTLSSSLGGEDVKVTSLVLFNDGGSASVADLANYRLMDGTVQVGDTEQAVGGTITFDITDGFVVPRSGAKTLKVVADANNVSAGDDLVLEVNGTNGVVATGMDSGVTVPNANKTVAATGYTTVTFQAQGLLRVTLDADTPIDQLVQAGTTVEVARYKFSADDEDVKVRELTVTTGKAKNADSDYGDKVSSNVVRVRVYDGATELGSGVFSSNIATINLQAGNELIIPKDGSKVLTFKVDLQPKEVLASHRTGELIHFGLANTGGDANANWGGAGTYNVDAVGVGSGAVIANINGSGVPGGQVTGANKVRTFDGILTITRNTGLVAGNVTKSTSQEVLRLDLTASGDDIHVYSINVDVATDCAGNNVSDGDAVWQDMSGNTEYVRITEADLGNVDPIGSGRNFSWGNSTILNPLTIAQGTTKTIKLKADTNSCDAPSNHSLQLRVQGTGGGANLSGETIASGVIWADDELELVGDPVDDVATEELTIDGPTFQY